MPGIYFDNEVGYDENLNISDVGQMSGADKVTQSHTLQYDRRVVKMNLGIDMDLSAYMGLTTKT
jgi:hypothetical protein